MNHVAYIGNIDLVLEREILGPYSEKVAVAVERGIDVTGRHMKADTKKGAPVDGGKWEPDFHPHRRGGTFKDHISHRRLGKGFSHSYTWYVRSPEHRLTHLLAKGHKLYIYGMKTGRRTKADPFVAKAHARARAELVPNVIKELPK